MHRHSSRQKDLDRQQLYDGVKMLTEGQSEHIVLPQQKLFTLFSISFQYLLYQAANKSGLYVVRFEDRLLAEKLCDKAKDPSTRKFLEKLVISRKIKFQDSIIFLVSPKVCLNKSPVETWHIPNFFEIISACVPFPHPCGPRNISFISIFGEIYFLL